MYSGSGYKLNQGLVCLTEYVQFKYKIAQNIHTPAEH
jgi:hypothetical protein